MMFVHDTPVQAQLADALALVRKTRSLAFPSHAPNSENCNDD